MLTAGWGLPVTAVASEHQTWAGRSVADNSSLIPDRGSRCGERLEHASFTFVLYGVRGTACTEQKTTLVPLQGWYRVAADSLGEEVRDRERSLSRMSSPNNCE